MSEDIFAIYQVAKIMNTRHLRFEPLDRLKARGLAVNRENYAHVYTGRLVAGVEPAFRTLDDLYAQFNIARPEDFTGHSLSVSDVIVLCRDGNITAHYVDRAGFHEVPEFVAGPFRYYSTQRPIDIGTFPNPSGNELFKATNFDNRQYVEGGAFQAWGVLTYRQPLTRKQIADYELRPAPGNPNFILVAPEQEEAQLQVIGKWEDAARTPDTRRITWWYPDFGVFLKKGFISSEQVAKHFEGIKIRKAIATQKRLMKKKPRNGHDR